METRPAPYAGQWWFEHRERADYRRVVFKPGKPNVISRYDLGNWLNLWRGWGVVPEKGRWPLLRNHVEQILSAGDPKVGDYTSDGQRGDFSTLMNRLNLR